MRTSGRTGLTLPARCGSPDPLGEWFAENGARVDRVVYVLGDDRSLPTWMLDLLGGGPARSCCMTAISGEPLRGRSESETGSRSLAAASLPLPRLDRRGRNRDAPATSRPSSQRYPCTERHRGGRDRHHTPVGRIAAGTGRRHRRPDRTGPGGNAGGDRRSDRDAGRKSRLSILTGWPTISSRSSTPDAQARRTGTRSCAAPRKTCPAATGSAS